MLISKNNSRYLRHLATIDFSKNQIVAEMVANGVAPKWVINPLKNGMLNEIKYFSKVVHLAANSFSEKISKNNDIFFEWNESKADFKSCFLVANHAVFIEKKDDLLYVVGFSSDVTTEKWLMCECIDFSRKTKDGNPVIQRYSSSEFILNYADKSDVGERIRASTIGVLIFLCFLHFVDLEEKIIKARDKGKNKPKDGRDANLSDFDITLVTSNYFTKIYVEGGFEVSGHWRLQPFGQDRKERKMIYISPYVKSGYTRRSDIELGKAM